MMSEKLPGDLKTDYKSNPKDDEWKFSKVFSLPEKGELYRFVAIPNNKL